MTKMQVTRLIDEAEEYLDSKFHAGSYCLMVNISYIQDTLSKIRAILPEEIKSAEMILKRRDDIYMEAQNRADRIINEAQNKAAGILSENELIKAVREKAASIQEQVKSSCEEMKQKAAEEAETLRKNAYQEAAQTKDSAKAYIQEMLANLEQDVDKVHKHIKTCQDYIAKQRPAANTKNQPETVRRREAEAADSKTKPVRQRAVKAE